MNWTIDDTWIVTIGAMCAVACALPGCFLVLRRMSMMGDAISHAVLPGLAAGFLLTGSRASLVMFIGAGVVGVLTAVFTQWVSKFGKVDRGAAMGIVFTTLFAIGLIMIRQAADHVDLDAGCVLYGAIELTILEQPVRIGAFAIPPAALMIGSVLIANLLIILLLFKEFRISSFDPALATTVGINANLMHYLLMTMVAVTTVAVFEAVGSIIVIAMLIVPPATAFLLTNRLSVMLAFSVVIGAISSILGHMGALSVPPLFGLKGTVTSGMMAAVAGGLFFLAWILGPEGLLITRVRGNREIEKPGSTPSGETA
jgi:manganese/zinc/iron transport system permease protein